MDTAVVGARVEALDGWRGLAIILVLFGHFLPYEPYNLGTLGVELFFVLSGRLMADILFVRKIEIGTFFFRRATRILPALAVFVVLLWLILALFAPDNDFSPLWIVASLTFTQNYAAVFGHGSGWLDHIWSVCVEEHSYLLLGLIAFVFARRMGPTLAVMLIVSLIAVTIGAVNIWVNHLDFRLVYTRSDVHVASIFMAVGVYLLVRHRMAQAVVARFATPVFFAAVLGGLVLHIEAIPYPISYSLGTLCLAVAVALVDVAARPVQIVLSNRVLTQAGLWSYSIYLWQQPFYKIDEWGMAPGMRVWLVMATIGCGVLSYLLIEKPSRQWLNALWARRRKVVAAQAAAPDRAAEIATASMADPDAAK